MITLLGPLNHAGWISVNGGGGLRYRSNKTPPYFLGHKHLDAVEHRESFIKYFFRERIVIIELVKENHRLESYQPAHLQLF